MPMMVNQGLPMMRALILGGTADANLLAEKIAQAGLEAIYPMAAAPARLPARSCRSASAASAVPAVSRTIFAARASRM